MGKILEYTMTNGRTLTWPIENTDDEDLIAEEMRDDWGFVKRYCDMGTVWLNKAHIISVAIKDEEEDF